MKPTGGESSQGEVCAAYLQVLERSTKTIFCILPGFPDFEEEKISVLAFPLRASLCLAGRGETSHQGTKAQVEGVVFKHKTFVLFCDLVCRNAVPRPLQTCGLGVHAWSTCATLGCGMVERARASKRGVQAPVVLEPLFVVLYALEVILLPRGMVLVLRVLSLLARPRPLEGESHPLERKELCSDGVTRVAESGEVHHHIPA